jgi:hypothetical protein
MHHIAPFRCNGELSTSIDAPAPTGSCVNGFRRSAVNNKAGPSRVPFGMHTAGRAQGPVHTVPNSPFRARDFTGFALGSHKGASASAFCVFVCVFRLPFVLCLAAASTEWQLALGGR